MTLKPFDMQALRGKSVFLDGYSWDENGFIITCLDDNPEKAIKKADIIFPSDVLNVRVTHEYQSWKIEEQISIWRGQSNSKPLVPPIFVVDESEYLEWYKHTETIDDDSRLNELKHFFFFIDDMLIEVIDDRWPKIITEFMHNTK